MRATQKWWAGQEADSARTTVWPPVVMSVYQLAATSTGWILNIVFPEANNTQGTPWFSASFNGTCYEQNNWKWLPTLTRLCLWTPLKIGSCKAWPNPSRTSTFGERRPDFEERIPLLDSLYMPPAMSIVSGNIGGSLERRPKPTLISPNIACQVK